MDNNFFKKKNISYDINYLKAEDLVARPTIERLTHTVPQINNDPVFISSLYALDPDMTPEVAEYFKKKAAKMREKENSKYVEAFAKMNDAHVLHELNSDTSQNKIVINENIV